MLNSVSQQNGEKEKWTPVKQAETVPSYIIPCHGSYSGLDSKKIPHLGEHQALGVTEKRTGNR